MIDEKKLIERLEEKSYLTTNDDGEIDRFSVSVVEMRNVKNIVNQLAEEYNQEHDDTDYANIELYEFWQKHQWISVDDRLPKDCDNRFYMCIVENHEEDLPMFCQYDEEYGFGFWHDIYDEHTLGFIDSEFRTNEELGYEKVIAWQQRPAPYQPKGE